MRAKAQSRRRRDRPVFTVGGIAVTRRQLVIGGLVLAGLAGLAALWGRIDLEAWHDRAQELPALGVLLPLCLLPLVGFPVSILHLIAGVRFGIAGGLAAVAVTTAAQHALAWLLVRLLPRRMFKRLRPWQEKFRHLGFRDTVMLSCLLPGVPYTGQIYLLPLMKVPLLLMLGLTTLLHTMRAIVTVVLGEFSDDLTPTRIVLLVAYYVMLLFVSWYLLRRIRRSAPDWPDPSRPAIAHES